MKLWNKWAGEKEEKETEVRDFKTEQKLFCEKYGSCKRETAAVEKDNDTATESIGDKVKTS